MNDLTLRSFAIDALAVHRITRLVIEDEITADFREWVLEHHGHPSQSKLSYFVTCPHCVSVWAAALVALMEFGSPTSGSRRSRVVRCTLGVLKNTLALSGAVSLGHEIAGKLPTPI